MIKHYITKYKVNGESRMCSWLQFELFGFAYPFSIKEKTL